MIYLDWIFLIKIGNLEFNSWKHNVSDAQVIAQ